MVIAVASEFGKSGREAPGELAGDSAFMTALRAVWVEAGLRMGLKKRDGTPMTNNDLAHSETIPKICIVAPPANGGSITARYFTPQSAHPSMAVSGGCCLAAATLIPGSVAYHAARETARLGREYSESAVAIENPAGVLDATIVARWSDSGLDVLSAAYRRSTQVLLRGSVPLYRASTTLRDALLRDASKRHFEIGAPQEGDEVSRLVHGKRGLPRN